MASKKLKRLQREKKSKFEIGHVIEKVFSNVDNPAAFSSFENIYKEAKRLNKNLTRNDVRQQLESCNAYTLHKPRRIKYPRLKTVPLGYMTDMQADLADFQKTATDNNGFRYLLVCVDVLSRKLFVAPVKSKSPKDMIPAFDIIFAQLIEPPLRLFTDKGLEFQAREMKKYFEKHGVLKYVAQSEDVKASIAERYIRTIKTRLYKYFTHSETYKWIDVIQKIVDGINNSVNRITKMRPIDVNKDNAKELWNRLYLTDLRTSKRYKKGDFVRIDNSRGAFDKGYLPNFSQEVFKVRAVKPGSIPNYRLEDLKGEDIIGKFYEPNLSKYNYVDEEKWDIVKKIHKYRYVGKGKNKKIEYLVTYTDDPDWKYWVDEDQLQ